MHSFFSPSIMNLVQIYVQVPTLYAAQWGKFELNMQ